MKASLEQIADDELRSFLEQKLDLIRTEYAPKHLILFGSRATGAPHEYSDIDLIIVSERFRGQRFVDRLVEFGELMQWPNHVDGLCYTPEEFQRKRREAGVVATACEEGIWLI